MQITTISYGRTVNRGDYNSEKLEMIAELAEGENHESALVELKDMIRVGLGGEKKETIEEVKEEKKTVKKKTVKKTSKKTTKKVEKEKEEKKEVKSEEVVDISLSDLKLMLRDVAINKGKNVAVEIVKSFGVAKSDEINEADYPKVVKQIKKALK